MIPNSMVEQIIRDLWNEQTNNAEYIMIDAVIERLTQDGDTVDREILASQMKQIAYRRSWHVSEGFGNNVGVYPS